MNYYTYEGPVVNNFNQVINRKWEGETYANSDKKAASNLSYQFKKEHGLLKTAKVKFTEKVMRG